MGIIKRKYDEYYFENFLYREKQNSHRNNNRLKELLKHKKCGRLLEAGCGKGEFLKLAAKHFKIEGIDISRHAARHAGKFLGEMIKVNDITRVDLFLDYYDVVVIFNLLEHILNPAALISKIHGALKNRGILIGSVPNNSFLIGSFVTFFANILDKTHCSTYPPHCWRKLFVGAGFRKIEFFGETTIGRNRNLYIRNRHWECLSFNLMFICEK